MNSNQSPPTTDACGGRPRKKCRVCGDQNFVFFNYGGLSCKSCKKFFARNAARIQEFVCIKFGSRLTNHSDNYHQQRICRIEVNNRRRSCRRCRLNRCFAIGMKQEQCREQPPSVPEQTQVVGVLDPNQNSPNRSDHQESSRVRPTLTSLTTRPPLPLPPPPLPIELYPSELDHLREAEDGCRLFCPSWSPSKTRAQSTTTTDYTVIGEVRDLTSALTVGELVVRRYLRFCKRLAAFRSLPVTDQVALVKRSYPETAAVYLAYYYEYGRKALPVASESDPSQAYLILLGVISGQERKRPVPPGSRQRCWNFTQSMRRAIGNDHVVRDLVFTQLLFKPRPDLQRVEYIRYHHHLYRRLLRRYLEQKHGSAARAAPHLHRLEWLLGRIEGATDLTRHVCREQVTSGSDCRTQTETTTVTTAAAVTSQLLIEMYG